MRFYRFRLLVVTASLAALVGCASESAGAAPLPGTPSASSSVVVLQQQIATLTRRDSSLSGQVARLKGVVTGLRDKVSFQTRQNDLLSTTNHSLTSHNTSLTSEVSAAEQTIGGTGNLAARVSALKALVGVQAVPADPALFSASFQQGNDSLGSDLISQLTVFLQEFSAGNFATLSDTHLTFTVGGPAPASLSALFPPAAQADPTTS